MSKKRALVFGNNNYARGVQLSCCIQNARDIGAKLKTIGFEVDLDCDPSYARSFVSFSIVVESIPPYPARWKSDGVTVAGGHGEGDRADQLNGPFGLFVDEDQTVYIADCVNHRIMGWKAGATTGEILAGGKGRGDGLDQLNHPTDVIVDRETDSLLICDQWNRRVMRWPRRPSSHRQPEILIDNIDCWG
jgi:hypothetical protein